MAMTGLDLWSAVDGYFGQAMMADDPILDQALDAQRAAGLPEINVAPQQGRLLQFLIRLGGARRVLEIGTLAGYSTIWMARGLPAGGRLVTLEFDPKHAEVAQANLVRAGLADRVDVRVGPALETLPGLAGEGVGPFDFVFIDADKISSLDYFLWALRLARPGAMIAVDNVVRKGLVIDGASTDPKVTGIRRLRDHLAAEPRVDATLVQTVGVKGHDGMILAMVKEPATASA